MIVLAKNVDYCGVSVASLYIVKSLVDKLDRHTVEILREICLPTFDIIAYDSTYLFHDLSATNSLLIRLASWVYGIGHQFEQ